MRRSKSPLHPLRQHHTVEGGHLGGEDTAHTNTHTQCCNFMSWKIQHTVKGAGAITVQYNLGCLKCQNLKGGGGGGGANLPPPLMHPRYTHMYPYTDPVSTCISTSSSSVRSTLAMYCLYCRPLLSTLVQFSYGPCSVPGIPDSILL